MCPWTIGTGNQNRWRSCAGRWSEWCSATRITAGRFLIWRRRRSCTRWWACCPWPVWGNTCACRGAGWSIKASAVNSGRRAVSGICLPIPPPSCAISPPVRSRASAPPTAVRIVEKFGDDTLRVMEEEPGRLSEIRGITPAKAKKIGEEFASQFGLREVLLAFSQYGLTPNEALRCWKRWGSATIEKVRDNPYLLCSSGLYIGFERADQICMGMDRRGRRSPPDRRRGFFTSCGTTLVMVIHACRRTSWPPPPPRCWAYRRSGSARFCRICCTLLSSRRKQ